MLDAPREGRDDGVELENGVGGCRCFTTDSLPRGYPGQYVRASAYAELDGERKRQSIYPGSGPRLWSSNSPTSSRR